METPFSKHLRDVQSKQTDNAQDILNQLPTNGTQQPTNILSNLTGGSNVQQAGDTAEMKLVGSKFDSSKDQVAQFAYSLRDQVQQGLISPADASLQMSNFVNDVTETHFPGFGEVNKRNKAQEIAQTYQVSPDKALDMLNRGIDPEKITRASTMSTSMGILSNVNSTPAQGGM